MLKPGGIMLAVREHVISDKTDLPAFLDIHPLHHLYGGENAFLLDEYETAIRQAGFTDIQVLSSWQSALNFAPHSLVTLQQAIAARFGPLAGVIRRALKLPGVWPLAVKLLTVWDRRPGRLYSFAAIKPRT